jgi:hypothetical protein
MKKLLLFSLIGVAIIIFIDFDSFIEKVNDFKNPTFNISVVYSSLEKDGTLTFKVLLENVTDSPISVDKLEITYIVLLKGKNYEKMNRNIIVKKIIDKKSELPVFVMLPDYYNSEIDHEASIWDKNKKKSFGIKISVKDDFDETIKWAKRNIDFST